MAFSAPSAVRGSSTAPSNRIMDLMVDGLVIVEVKCVDKLAPIHRAQMLTYLRLTECPVGLVIDFNVTALTDGIRRVANNLRDEHGHLA